MATVAPETEDQDVPLGMMVLTGGALSRLSHCRVGTDETVAEMSFGDYEGLLVGDGIGITIIPEKGRLMMRVWRI